MNDHAGNALLSTEHALSNNNSFTVAFGRSYSMHIEKYGKGRGRREREYGGNFHERQGERDDARWVTESEDEGHRRQGRPRPTWREEGSRICYSRVAHGSSYKHAIAEGGNASMGLRGILAGENLAWNEARQIETRTKIWWEMWFDPLDPFLKGSGRNAYGNTTRECRQATCIPAMRPLNPIYWGNSS